MNKKAKRSSRHKVNALMDNLRSRIISGELHPGEELPPMEELANANGTSVITVNRIMARLSKDGLLERVKGRGTFVSRNPKAKGSFTIGIVDFILGAGSSDLDRIMVRISNECSSVLSQLNIRTRQISYNDLLDPGKTTKLFDGLDGLLINYTHLDERTKPQISKFDIPKVMYHNEFIEKIQFDQVIPDFDTEMSRIAKGITTKRFSEVVIVYEPHSNAMVRRDAFKAAVIAGGFPADRIFEIIPQCVGQSDGGYRIASQLFKEPKSRFIFSTSDFVSFGILDAMHDYGIVPGGNVQLLSSDDLEGYGFRPYSEETLTSINPSRVCIAQKAVKLLLEKIRNPDPCQYIIKVPTTLTVRKTALIN